MISQLAGGDFGVRLQLPSALQLLEEDEHSAQLRGDNGVVYFLFYFPGLHMVFRPGLEEAMARHARRLFDETFLNLGGDGRKRTDDPNWSPLVEVVPLGMGGMQTVHRMVS